MGGAHSSALVSVTLNTASSSSSSMFSIHYISASRAFPTASHFSGTNIGGAHTSAPVYVTLNSMLDDVTSSFSDILHVHCISASRAFPKETLALPCLLYTFPLLFIGGVHSSTLVSVTECDISENFDTNECPNIFVSTKLHE